MVAKYNSFSKAGQALYLSQPTISSHIKALEADLGVQLVVRTTKEVLLSDAGKAFLEYANELLYVRDMAYKKLKEYSESSLGTLKISATTTASQALFDLGINTFLRSNPSIKIDLIHSDSRHVIDSVQNFDTELGLCNMSDPQSKCSFRNISSDNLVFILPNNEYFFPYYSMPPEELLKSVPLVWRGSGSGTNNTAEAYIESLGLSVSDLNIRMHLHSTEDIREAVISGVGASFLSINSIRHFANAGMIKVLEFDSPLLKRELYLVTHKKMIMSPVAELFVNFIDKL